MKNYVKRFIYLLTSLLLIISACPINANALELSAQSAVVIDAYSGKIIYEKNAHTKLGMASTTKIMTALTAIENYPLDKSFKVDDSAIGVEGSSIYLKKGEVLTMQQLLYALLLQSANDAATAIAVEVGGSVEMFADMMNVKAKEMGLKNTHFTNPHGLYDENHYTTSHDLAIITQHALTNEVFKKIVSTYKTDIPLDGQVGGRVLVNHNKLLKIYDGAIGVKTGFTKKTGRCLVSAAEKDGTTLIAVTLNAPNDWDDHKKMLDLGFDTIKTVTLAEKDSFCFKVPVVGGTSNYVTVKNTGVLRYTCPKNHSNITSELILDRFLFAPIEPYETIGTVIFYDNGEEIGRVDLISQETVAKKQPKKKFLGLF